MYFASSRNISLDRRGKTFFQINPLLTTLLFLAPNSDGVFGQATNELISDFFSSSAVEIGTVIFVSCSADDELLWLKHVPKGGGTFYTGRGNLTENCELATGALRDSSRRIGVFVDYDCQCAKHAAMKIDSYNFTVDVISWLFWSAQVRAEDLEHLQLNLKLYNEVRFALQDNGNIKLYDVYRIYEGMPVEWALTASWNASVGLAWHRDLFKYWRRLDFRNVTLQGGLMLQELNLTTPNLLEKLKVYDNDKNKDTFARVFYILWEIVQQLHNFSLNITTIDNVGYTKNSEGIYDGLIGLLQSGKIDLAVSGLGLMDYRLPIIDYTNTAIWPFRSCFFFLQPRFLDRSTILIYPFRAIVWLTSFIVILLSAVTISFVARFDKSIRVSIGSTILYISAIFSQQGAVLTSQWISGRFLLFTTLIYGYILLNYYSGQVVSQILARAPSKITTPRQLLDSSFLLSADEVPLFLRARYKMRRSHNMPELGMKIEKTGGFMSTVQGIARVRSSFYAFDTDVNKAYYHINKTFTQGEICNFGEVCFPDEGLFVALKRHSPFKQSFSITVLLLNERGLLKRLVAQWRNPKPQCTEGTAVNIIPVDLENVSVAFYVLFAGAVLGCISLFVESSYSKLPRFKSHKKSTSIRSLLK